MLKNEIKKKTNEKKLSKHVDLGGTTHKSILKKLELTSLG